MLIIILSWVFFVYLIPIQERFMWASFIEFPCRIGMVRMDTVDLSSGSEVYTPDVEEVSCLPA